MASCCLLERPSHPDWPTDAVEPRSAAGGPGGRPGGGAGGALRRYLVVGDEALDHPGVIASILADRVPGARFHLLVPTRRSVETRRLVASTGDPLAGLVTGGLVGLEESMERDRAAATRRLALTMARFRAAGADVSGEVGPADPVVAAVRAVGRSGFDQILVASRPSALVRWLRLDPVHRLRHLSPVPVVAVMPVTT